jgi:hypothetical protein
MTMLVCSFVLPGVPEVLVHYMYVTGNTHDSVCTIQYLYVARSTGSVSSLHVSTVYYTGYTHDNCYYNTFVLAGVPVVLVHCLYMTGNTHDYLGTIPICCQGYR